MATCGIWDVLWRHCGMCRPVKCGDPMAKLWRHVATPWDVPTPMGCGVWRHVATPWDVLWRPHVPTCADPVPTCADPVPTLCRSLYKRPHCHHANKHLTGGSAFKRIQSASPHEGKQKLNESEPSEVKRPCHPNEKLRSGQGLRKSTYLQKYFAACAHRSTWTRARWGVEHTSCATCLAGALRGSAPRCPSRQTR